MLNCELQFHLVSAPLSRVQEGWYIYALYTRNLQSTLKGKTGARPHLGALGYQCSYTSVYFGSTFLIREQFFHYFFFALYFWSVVLFNNNSLDRYLTTTERFCYYIIPCAVGVNSLLFTTPALGQLLPENKP